MKKTLFITVLCLFLMSFSGVAVGQEWFAKTNVPIDHTWTIKFSQPIKPIDNSYERQLYILDPRGEIVSHTSAYSNDMKILTLKPSNNYTSNTTYYLHITDKVQSLTGQTLQDTIIMPFTTIKYWITLSESFLLLTEGDAPYTLTATVYPHNATYKNLTWYSDHPEVATVNDGIITPIKEGTTKIIVLAASDSSVFAKCNVTVKKTGTAIPNIDTIDDLIEYLNANFTTLETPMGTWRFSHSYDENEYSFFPEDYQLKTDYLGSDVSPYDIKYSIKYTDSQKEETKELLREYQLEIALIAMTAFPNKKITGGYYHSGYSYPNIHAGFYSIRFLTWKNYDGRKYADSQITNFQWDAFIDDYDFTK